MTVKLLGQDWDVRLPETFLEREDIYRHGFNRRIHAGLVYAATLGRCTRLGVLAKADAEKRQAYFPNYGATFELLPYGAAMFEYLRRNGATAEAIQDAATPIVDEICEIVSPTREEIDVQKKDSPPPPADPT